MKPGISFNILTTPKTDESSWRPHWPNPADFRFDYYKLLKNAPNGIGRLPGYAKSVAVVGAGAAGMTAARELYRCGFSVTIFEASDRIGGRLYTRNSPVGSNQEGYEMGAMRMPFFGDRNSILEYYLVDEPGSKHSAILNPFPNPGQTPGDPGTGIYVNGGLGPRNDYEEPKFIPWPDGDDPDDEELQKLNKEVQDFVQRFTDLAADLYMADTDEWEVLWDKITARYDAMTFNDFVLLERTNPMNSATGDLGGLGMTPEQADLLYTIGVGDGSWGAFYSIAALWFMRCTLFGFSSKLQTVEGLRNSASLIAASAEEGPNASADHLLPVPRFQGIQAMVEYLYYIRPPGSTHSLRHGSRLLLNTAVQQIKKNKSQKLEVTYPDSQGTSTTTEFDFAFVTSATWASQMSFKITGFSESELPQKKITAMATQHSISSCKLFFPLSQKFWEREDNKIPQIIITDTFVQDVYGLDWKTSKPNGSGILLASYTWEDDSLKLLPFDVEDLTRKVLGKLQEITVQTTGQDITNYIASRHPVFIQWIQEPTYHGCSKLYRAHTEANNARELAYNQQHAGLSKLYFAGESYGVEGGWTEPALRSAIDGVIQLLKNEGGNFQVENFDVDKDYPKWQSDETIYEFPGT